MSSRHREKTFNNGVDANPREIVFGGARLGEEKDSSISDRQEGEERESPVFLILSTSRLTTTRAASGCR